MMVSFPWRLLVLVVGCFVLLSSFHDCNAQQQAFSFGNNGDGQLGDNSFSKTSLPVPVETSGVLAGKSLYAIAAGGKHSLILESLESSGSVDSWGRNANGQLGDNTKAALRNTPVQVFSSGLLNGKNITAIAAGDSHSLVLASTGQVFSFGYNSYGQLGDGTNTDRNFPVAVSTSGVLNGKTIIAIAAGDDHSLVLISTGHVFSFGYNSNGQLGDGTGTTRNTPVAVLTSGVLNGKTITAIAAGGAHSLVLSSTGKVFSFGSNSNGQLGDGTNTQKSKIPVAVSTSGVLSGKTVTAIAAGGSHSLVLTSNGQVYSFGQDSFGQLGDDSTTSNKNTPVAVSTSGTLYRLRITAIAAGRSHSLVLASNGQVFSFGDNRNGQLGDGTNTQRKTPVAVSTMGNLLSGRQVTAISAGQLHSLVLSIPAMENSSESLISSNPKISISSTQSPIVISTESSSIVVSSPHSSSVPLSTSSESTIDGSASLPSSGDSNSATALDSSFSASDEIISESPTWISFAVVVTFGLFCALVLVLGILIIAIIIFIFVMRWGKPKPGPLNDNNFELRQTEMKIDLNYDFSRTGDSTYQMSAIQASELTDFEQIGTGRFSTIYKTTFKGKNVILKLLDVESHDENEFSREVQTMMRLEHPQLLQFMGIVHTDGKFGIVTEWMRRGSFDKMLWRKNRADIKLLWRWKIKFLSDAALGMAFIHSRGFIHRDLKSSTIFIDEHNQAKIANVGWICVIEKIENKTAKERHAGLPQWMSPAWTAPEVIASAGNSIDSKCDVFSFGIVMWEVLAEKEPYHDIPNKPASVMKNVLRDPNFRPSIPTLDDTVKGLRPAEEESQSIGRAFKPFVKLMCECWSHNPDARPTFDQLVKRLQREEMMAL